MDKVEPSFAAKLLGGRKLVGAHPSFLYREHFQVFAVH